MRCELYNNSTETIMIVHNGTITHLSPCTSIKISSVDDEVCLDLLHIHNKKLSVIWYVLNALFTLEQMRTVLVVDGTYVIQSSDEHTLVKVKDYEYVFEKNTAYQTFVFNVKGGCVVRKSLSVANRKSILRKAKFLYLFGGKKTFLPLSGAMFIAAILGAPTVGSAAFTCTLAVLAASVFIWSLMQYIRSLGFLKRVTKGESILHYLSSQRNECRQATDNLVQKYMDKNAGDEVFW